MKNQIPNRKSIICRLLKDIKEFIDDDKNFKIDAVHYVARKKYLKREYNFDKLFDEATKKKIEEELTNYVNSIYPDYLLKVYLEDNSFMVIDCDRYVTKSTLLSAWGKKLFDKYIDKPCKMYNIEKYGKWVDIYLYGMYRIRRIEASSMFQSDWNKHRRKSFEDRYKGFDNTNYKKI